MFKPKDLLYFSGGVLAAMLISWSVKSAYRGEMLPIPDYISDNWYGVVYAFVFVALFRWHRSRASGW